MHQSWVLYASHTIVLEQWNSARPVNLSVFCTGDANSGVCIH